ncbi:MAG: cell division protein FtsA [Paracoccaceae bacterium]|uniref:cell division protein FtsA n=1 Tax=Candidatus Salinivivens marinus TaxID=3381703 RepID=UPI000BE0BDE8|nr:MAG: cell division protein FtsA [Rhodobacteraceae bacterium MED-G08]|tara:strand:- start:383 stop:1720 length:1338 start_codon:yes stop_codon:yes gene_type:complete
MADLYELQRAMRAMRQSALQRGALAILDLGSTKIGCLILRFDGLDPSLASDQVGSLAGQSSFQVVGSAITRSRGIEFGEISSMQEAERAIRTVLQSAQKMANLRVDHLIACFSGGGPRSYGLNGVVKIENQIVRDEDIARVLSSCDLPDIGDGREILHAQPVNFALDHRSGLVDPRGQIGNNLDVDLHILTVRAKTIRDLAHCVKRCDLELAGVASAAYVSGRSTLVEDEQELGAVCIDFGGGSTSYSIFLKKHMIFAGSIMLGGNHVTRDISLGLQVPMAVAEKIKTKNGGLIATGIDDRDLIEVGGETTGDWEHDRRTVTRSELIGIMRPRIEEILEDVRAQLEIAGFYELKSQKFVLTGGTSQTPGLDTLASRILGQQVRIGRPLRIHRLPQAYSGSSCSALVGLALFAAHPQDEWWDFELPNSSYSSRTVRKAVRWLRENW